MCNITVLGKTFEKHLFNPQDFKGLYEIDLVLNKKKYHSHKTKVGHL